jgi:hypothetical protein
MLSKLNVGRFAILASVFFAEHCDGRDLEMVKGV